MSPVQIALMAVIGLLFACWTWLMFATLMGQRRRAMQRTGQMFPGLRDALLEWGNWLQAPALRAERRRLALVTALLFLLIFAMAAFLPAFPYPKAT